jgi:uncharacterized protein (DUF305 family)
MQQHQSHNMKGSYKRLGIEAAIDFVIMYLVMYSMIATLDHLYINLNNVYMTLMMVAPMTIIMQLSMRSMFPSPRLNAIIVVGAAFVFIASFVAMRKQTAIGNAQFLRSMIPHHSGAILMCKQASITDPEIVTLCRDIIEAQKKEIAQMQAILARY